MCGFPESLKAEKTLNRGGQRIFGREDWSSGSNLSKEPRRILLHPGSQKEGRRLGDLKSELELEYTRFAGVKAPCGDDPMRKKTSGQTD